jgi:NTE family protein
MVNVRHPVGARLDMDQLEQDIAMIYGTELFETVTTRIAQRDGRTGIVIDAKAKSWGPNYLQFGMDLEDDFEGDTLYNIRIAYLQTVRNFRGAEWRLGVTVGQEPGVSTEWYQPIDRTRRYFITPQIALQKYNLTEYRGGDRVAEFRFGEASATLAAGRIFSNWGELRVGYEAATGDTSLRVGDPDLPTPDYDLGRIFARFSVDTLDNAYFPTSGMFLQATYSWHRPDLGDDESFDQAHLEASLARSWGRYTLVPGVEMGKSTRGDTPFYTLFRAGGFLRLSGFENNELSGQALAIGRTIFYRRMNDITFLPVYFGGSLEYGSIGDHLSLRDGRAAGSLFLGVDSFFGPLYLGAGLAEGGNASGYMFLGQRF